MKNARLRVAAIAVIATIGGAVLLSQSPLWRPVTVVSDNRPLPPHTLQLRDYVQLPGQTRSLSREITRAVRGDGSVAESYRHYDPKTGAYKGTQRVLLGVGGVYAEASPDISLLSSLKQDKLDYKRLTMFGNVSTNCTEYLTTGRIGELISREAMLGHEVIKMKTNEDSASVAYQWRAPHLGCALVRQEMKFKGADGSVRDSNVLEAVSITTGEPGPELFTFSREFTLASPLQYQRRLHKHLAGEDVPDSALPPSLFQLEQLYNGASDRPPAKFDPRS